MMFVHDYVGPTLVIFAILMLAVLPAVFMPRDDDGR